MIPLFPLSDSPTPTRLSYREEKAMDAVRVNCRWCEKVVVIPITVMDIVAHRVGFDAPMSSALWHHLETYHPRLLARWRRASRYDT